MNVPETNNPDLMTVIARISQRMYDERNQDPGGAVLLANAASGDRESLLKVIREQLDGDEAMLDSLHRSLVGRYGSVGARPVAAQIMLALEQMTDDELFEIFTDHVVEEQRSPARS